MNRIAYVHLGYGFAADLHRDRYRKGLVPDEVPYGFHHAESLGWNVTYSVDHPENFLVRFVRRGLGSVLGFDLVHAWRNRRLISKSNVVWSMEERQGLAVLFLGLFRSVPPVILQVIWLFDRWQTLHSVRRRLYRSLLLRAARVTVHSRRYEEANNFDLGIQPVLLPFGISSDSFPYCDRVRPSHHPVRVLAMGSDPTRDWATFLKAFASDPRFALIAISPQLKPVMTNGIQNLDVPVAPSMSQFVDFYAWADLVVIPMVHNLYSGITVALEATRQGVPVVCSRTGGVPTYLAEDEAIYVEPENAVALRETVLACDEQQRAAVVAKAQMRFALEDYTTRGMAARYVRLSEECLGEATHQNESRG